MRKPDQDKEYVEEVCKIGEEFEKSLADAEAAAEKRRRDSVPEVLNHGLPLFTRELFPVCAWDEGMR